MEKLTRINMITRRKVTFIRHEGKDQKINHRILEKNMIGHEFLLTIGVNFF